jgi:hypothetical protein
MKMIDPDDIREIGDMNGGYLRNDTSLRLESLRLEREKIAQFAELNITLRSAVNYLGQLLCRNT